MDIQSPRRESESAGLLRVIAIFKFIKAMTLVGTGSAALELLNPTVVDFLNAWADALPHGAEQHVALHVLGWLTGLSPLRIKALGLGAFVVAGLFFTEGIGLWFRKRWAEWLTTIATASLIPVEIWELFAHTTLPKALALALNVLVVGYLIFRIKSAADSRSDDSKKRTTPPLTSSLS